MNTMLQVRLFSSFRSGLYITVGYVLLVFASLPFTARLLALMRHNYLMTPLVVILFIGAMLFIIWAGYKADHLRKISFWLSITTVALTYIYANYKAVSMSDPLHLWLYALLGFLLFSLLRFRFAGGKLFGYVFILAFMIGLLDESIQYFIPNRIFGFDDILFNALGVLISFMVIKYVFGDDGRECVD